MTNISPNKKLCKSIGKRLRARRKVLSMTLVDMSVVSGLSVPYLSDMERGVVNMSISVLDIASKSYDLKIPLLFKGIKS